MGTKWRGEQMRDDSRFNWPLPIIVIIIVLALSALGALDQWTAELSACIERAGHVATHQGLIPTIALIGMLAGTKVVK